MQLKVSGHLCRNRNGSECMKHFLKVMYDSVVPVMSSSITVFQLNDQNGERQLIFFRN